jgi:hypothetical protein
MSENGLELKRRQIYQQQGIPKERLDHGVPVEIGLGIAV